jgi:drug/metabolite transporter (DMT)-like permease
LSLAFLPGLHNAVKTAPIEATIAAVYLGVFSSAVAYVAWAFVLSRIPAARASSLLYAVPVIAVAVGWLWLREIPSMGMMLGGLMALMGVVLVRVPRRIGA